MNARQNKYKIKTPRLSSSKYRMPQTTRKILKTTRRKGNIIRLTIGFSGTTMEARKQWDISVW